MRKRDIKENKKYDRWCKETLRKVDIGEFSGKIEYDSVYNDDQSDDESDNEQEPDEKDTFEYALLQDYHEGNLLV